MTGSNRPLVKSATSLVAPRNRIEPDKQVQHFRFDIGEAGEAGRPACHGRRGAAAGAVEGVAAIREPATQPQRAGFLKDQLAEDSGHAAAGVGIDQAAADLAFFDSALERLRILAGLEDE